MATWRRAQPWTVSTIFGALWMLLLPTSIIIFLSVLMIAGGVTWYVNPVLGLLLIYVPLSAWLVLAIRYALSGIQVSDQAVKVGYPWHTVTIPWSDVSGVESRPATVSSSGKDALRQAIWLLQEQGPAIETPVQRRGPIYLSFVPWRVPRGFDKAGLVLSPHAYQKTIDVLNRYRDDARRRLVDV